MKKNFLSAILMAVLVGFVGCNQPNNGKPTFYHFESIKLKNNVMAGAALNGLLPTEPTSSTPFTVRPSSLTEELYNKLWNDAKDYKAEDKSYTKAQFKTAYVPHNADDVLKAAMEYALNDLITRGKLGVVIYAIYTPVQGSNPAVIKYYAVFNKR